MSKILRNHQTEEIKDFLNENEKISSKLKEIILHDLKRKEQLYKNASIWLITKMESVIIDAFDIKGEILETDTFYFKDFTTSL